MSPRTEGSPALVAFALDYARAGYPVLPLHSIIKPAPAEIVKQWRDGKLDKKAAQAHAVCSCGESPCKSPGKHPRVKGSSADAKQIERWWRTWPDANVGIRMPAGLVALDFDTYSKGVEGKLNQLRLLRVETLEQVSGAGGTHLIFSNVPEGVKLGSTLDSESGVDLIHAGNRYLVAEPSSHWSGGTYRWANNAEPAPLPPQLVARVTQGAKPTRPRRERARGMAPDIDTERVAVSMPLEFEGTPLDWAVELASKVLPPAIADSEPEAREHGHATLTRAAGYLAVGLDLGHEQALEVLWEEYNERCIPPWDGSDGYADFERTVLAATSGEPGYLIPKEHERVLAADADARAAKRQAEKVAPAKPASSAAAADLNADDSWPAELGFVVFDRGQEPEPIEYVWRVFGAGKVSALVAYAYSAKTPTALLLAACVATGLPCLGAPTRQRKTLYVATEGARNARIKAQRIARGLGTSLAEIGDRLDIVQAPSGMLNIQTADTLCKAAYAKGYGFVVLDTYGSALDGAIDRNANLFSDALKQLGDCSDATGIVFVVLLHLNKKGAESAPTLQALDGHNSVAGAIQGAVGLHRPDPKNEHTIEVTCVRRADEGFEPFLVRWVDRPFSGPTSESVRLRAEGHDVDRGALVAEVIAGNGGGKYGAVGSELAAAARKTEMRAAIVAALTRHANSLTAKTRQDIGLTQTQIGDSLRGAEFTFDNKELGPALRAAVEAEDSPIVCGAGPRRTSPRYFLR